MANNWRQEVEAGDYFLHQRKRTDIEQRRPQIRKASDLVGPGIASASIRLSDFDDTLSTFNGYYSALAGTPNAPNSNEPFVGMTTMDALFGGVQTFTGMYSFSEYTRLFQRNPGDSGSITWSRWLQVERVPASASRKASDVTTVAEGPDEVFLAAPTLSTIGFLETYSSSGSTIKVLRQGVYTGYVQIDGPDDFVLTAVNLALPQGLVSRTISAGAGVPMNGGIWIPFTFWTTVATQDIRISVRHNTVDAAPKIVWSEFVITRTGSAVKVGFSPNSGSIDDGGDGAGGGDSGGGGTVLTITDNGDGTWTADGPASKISQVDATSFKINSAQAVFIDAQSYTVTSES